MSLTHAFVSAVADEAVAGRVQPSHWNAAHVFGGGALGALLYRDPAQVDGAQWLPAGAAGAVLVSGGVGVAPAWSTAPVLAGLMVGTLAITAEAPQKLQSSTNLDLAAEADFPVRIFSGSVAVAQFVNHSVVVGGASVPSVLGVRVIALGQGAVPASNAMGANTAAFYTADVGGTAMLHVIDEAGNTGRITPLVSKATAGDPAGFEGLLAINTTDHTVKVYAGGAWRTLVASW